MVLVCDHMGAKTQEQLQCHIMTLRQSIIRISRFKQWKSIWLISAEKELIKGIRGLTRIAGRVKEPNMEATRHPSSLLRAATSLAISSPEQTRSSICAFTSLAAGLQAELKPVVSCSHAQLMCWDIAMGRTRLCLREWGVPQIKERSSAAG